MKVLMSLSFIVLSWLSMIGASGVTPDAPVLPNSPSLANPSGISAKMSGSRNIVSLNDMDQGLAEIAGKEIAEYKQQGYIAIDDEQIQRFLLKNYAEYFLDPKQVKENTSFTIDTINNPNLELQGLIGADFNNNHRYESVLRVFTLKGTQQATDHTGKNVTVSIEETDYRNAGIHITLVKEMFNADINGTPAVVTLRRAPSGLAVVLATWVTNTKIYKITLAGENINKAQENAVIKLARTLGN